MSATEEPVPVDPPAATESTAAPAEAEAETVAPAADEEPKTKPASSSAKKATASKPAKGRPSAAGASKKGGASAADENRKYEVGDIVLARLRGYPPWREYSSCLTSALGVHKLTRYLLLSC